MDHKSIPIIRISGRYLYAGDERFIVRGIVYQSSPPFLKNVKRAHTLDALQDNKIERLSSDVKLLRELNINTLIVHTIDPTKSHTKCMQLLADNGIYVLFQIEHRSSTGHPEIEVPEGLLEHHAKVIDAVASYRNTLGVCVANHLVNRLNLGIEPEREKIWHNIAFVVREMRRYMRYRNHDTGQRILPIGINEAQRSSLRTTTFNYLTDPVTLTRPAGGNIDFYCFSHYDAHNDPHAYTRNDLITLDMKRDKFSNSASELLGKMSFPNNPLAEEQKPSVTDWELQLPLPKFNQAQNPVPVIISAYGSNMTRPREFLEVRQLYGQNMRSPLLQTLSGGFLKEFENLGNNYGLVHQAEDGGVHPSLQEFANFREAMAEAVGAQASTTTEFSTLGSLEDNDTGESSKVATGSSSGGHL